MLAIEVVDASSDKVLERFPTTLENPEPLFVKDRSTKHKYVMIRTRGSAPDAKKQLFETRYDQYSGVYFRIVNIL